MSWYVETAEQLGVNADLFQAEQCLTDAWNLCHKDAMRNKE